MQRFILHFQQFERLLTQDETGLSTWTIDHFKKAIREGKYKGLDGSLMITPPMPWQNYGAINEEVLANLWIYLKSIKPVKNVVPAYIPPTEGQGIRNNENKFLSCPLGVGA